MKKLLIWMIIVIIAFVMAFAIFLGLITWTDFRPETEVPCRINGKAEGKLPADSIFSIMTWNLGYFGLGKECDFFYDGGRMTRPDEQTSLKYSTRAIGYLEELSLPDFFFFQEVDLDSRRSYRKDQSEMLQAVFPGYEYCVALNYKVLFVPVPFRDPQGEVNSGIVTFSEHASSGNTRFAFPGGFSWPVGLFMLDRCFLLSRIPVAGDRELVLVNTHNEAFGDGSQRRQQMAILRETVMKEYDKGNYVVAGGDWNLNPLGFNPGLITTSDMVKRIEPAVESDFLPPEWQWVFDHRTPTNRNVDQWYTRGKTPVTIIDFFVVSPNIQVVEKSTEDLGFEWSDHNPVRMKFRLL